MSAVVRRVNWGNLDVPSCQVLCSVSAWCGLYDLKAVVVGERERERVVTPIILTPPQIKCTKTV